MIIAVIILNRKNNNPSISTQEETPIQLNENKQSLNLALDNIFTNWSFINQFKSTANIKSSQLNEVCDESYCVSFTQIENLLIISYSPKETAESETKVYDLNNNSVVLKGKFYVGKMDYNRNQLNISDQGYNDNGRFYRDGTLDLKTLSINWGEKQF